MSRFSNGLAVSFAALMSISAAPISAQDAGARIVADIAPVHSILSAVTDGAVPATQLDLLIPPASSPHSYSLRPSQARALDDAELVVWVGEALSPWLEDVIDNLASEARILEALEIDGVELLSFREDPAFSSGHDHDADGHDEHDHDAHGDDEHEHDAHGHDKHDHDAHGHDEHDHDGADPHAWLDPRIAAIWAEKFAEELSDIDPKNAALYSENAQAFSARMTELEQELGAMLSPVKDKPYVVFHDAYQYFEARFGLSPVGAVSPSDASDPSPARVAGLRDHVSTLGAVCALAEPQHNPSIFAALGEVKIGTIDPLGAEIVLGAEHYEMLLKNMATSIVDCLN